MNGTMVRRPMLVACSIGIPALVAGAACYEEDTVGWPCPAEPPVTNCWHQLVGDSTCFEPNQVTNGFNRIPATSICKWEWKTLDEQGNCTVTHTNYEETRACHQITGTECKNGGGGGGT
jgi:hypothetical protein